MEIYGYKAKEIQDLFQFPRVVLKEKEYDKILEIYVTDYKQSGGVIFFYPSVKRSIKILHFKTEWN